MIPDTYYELLGRIHEHLRPTTYLEIGVHEGHSLALAHPTTIVVGVDPQPAITAELRPEVTIVEATSDDFFATWPVRSLLGGHPVELAFIDGMHHFEYALRDFLNIERIAGPESVVLIHDCLPVDRATSERERSTVLWSGDVWKLVLCLRRYRPDLHVTTLDTAPTGLGVVTGLDPGSTVLRDRLAQLYAELMPLTYDDLVEMDRERALNVAPGDWSTARSLLGEAD